jgi:hypothetical protein
VVALHDAGEAAALAGADDIDEVAGLEEVSDGEGGETVTSAFAADDGEDTLTIFGRFLERE